MRTNKYILLAATLLGLSSCGNKRGDYDASGTFEATEVIVSSEANGKIMQFNIEEGQLLKAGEEVGCIDTLQLYLKKMQLLASGKAIASKSTDINKQIAATKEQIGKAEYERKRTENLLKENAATQKQIDDIDSQIAVLKKQLEAQISTLQRGNASITEESSAYEIQVAQLDDQLRKCHITSPICGTVLAKYAEAGELATQGKPLFKVADVQHLFLRAYITEIFAGAIRSVPHGEIEAARAYGFSSVKLYRCIILPSALRIALPAYSNEVILMLHSTALAFTATVPDLLKIARDINSATYQPFTAFGIAAVLYLIISYVLISLFRKAEKRWLQHIKPSTH